jgi:hypothetical protein
LLNEEQTNNHPVDHNEVFFYMCQLVTCSRCHRS